MSQEYLSFFSGLQESLEKESARRDEIRDKVKDLDRTCRLLQATLDKIYTNIKGPVPEITFESIQESVRSLAALIPKNEFYKYNDLWQRALQQAVSLAAFHYYLHHEELIDLATVEKTIGAKVDVNNDLNEFCIPVETVLHAYISLIQGLSRLARIVVTAGDYERPARISTFAKDLAAGFQVLNLKNDMLRKRFDGIKYSVKEIEEVNYDISLRGLAKKALHDGPSDNETEPVAKKPKHEHEDPLL